MVFTLHLTKQNHRPNQTKPIEQPYSTKPILLSQPTLNSNSTWVGVTWIFIRTIIPPPPQPLSPRIQNAEIYSLDMLIVLARDEQSIFFPWKLSKLETIGWFFTIFLLDETLQLCSFFSITSFPLTRIFLHIHILAKSYITSACLLFVLSFSLIVSIYEDYKNKRQDKPFVCVSIICSSIP